MSHPDVAPAGPQVPPHAAQDALVSPDARRELDAILLDGTLTYRQRIQRLAAFAETLHPMPPVSDATREALDARVICDMYEGHAPYRPRYLLPDYAAALAQGSAYLELPPPRTLHEATWFLASLYANVPSITGYPVYLGDLDALLAPYADGLSEDAIVDALRPFWRALDRMLPDAFVHANLGPEDTPTLRAILRLERELKQVVPNLSLKVAPGVTSDALLRDAVETVFACAKPHFVNDPMMRADHGEGYAAVSCYNALKIGGGAHTLVRLNLKEAALRHEGPSETFAATTLASYVDRTGELMEARIRHLVERSGFFEHDWLVAEGLVSLDRFSAMFGVFGLAEAVNHLVARDEGTGRYGHDRAADALAADVVRAVADRVAQRPQPYCDGFGGRAMMHAQSGIDLDEDVTAGTRIPIGDEPDLLRHLQAVAPHHAVFASGVSDVLHFDETAVRHPDAVVDVVRGAMAQGMRDVTFNLDSNDFIRITGYLVKKSDVADVGAGARHASTYLGAGNEASAHCSTRTSKRVTSAERAAGS